MKMECEIDCETGGGRFTYLQKAQDTDWNGLDATRWREILNPDPKILHPESDMKRE